MPQNREYTHIKFMYRNHHEKTEGKGQFLTNELWVITIIQRMDDVYAKRVNGRKNL